jgi:prolyl-tRNA editing enzyme YbaK/EbsC (Cys-tRNA(Pro) deacylase)
MIQKMGKLEMFSVAEKPELIAEPVAKALAAMADTESVGVAEIDPNLSDTAAFCAEYEVTPNQAANCVILEAKQGEERWFAACIVLADTRADVNGIIKKTLEVRRVSFAPMDKAVTESKMEYGAITPIGLPTEWPILVDKAVADSEAVIIGSGIRKSKLAVSGSFLASLPNARVIEGLAQKKEVV